MDYFQEGATRAVVSENLSLRKIKTMFQGKDLRTFYKTFPDESSCMKYLSEVKWEDGYKCIKCGNDHSNKGNKPFYRRCLHHQVSAQY